jgi:membrane protein DedA with SNARE-associated domain
MPDFVGFIRQYISFFPPVAFISLLLAGLNFPISEDLIIITGALLSHGRRANIVYNLAAIYLGAIISDFFVYWVGTKVQKGTSNLKFFSRPASGKALERMHHYLDKYGIFTFIVGRFIPFGVRNTLFFTAGFFRLKLRVFALYDIIAAMISINTLFFLAYNFGDDAGKPLRIAGIVLFILLVSVGISLIIRLIVLWRRQRKN